MTPSLRRSRTLPVLAALFAIALAMSGNAAAAALSQAGPSFTDDFDGPAGSGVDGGKWQLETGDNVNNHERQYYTPAPTTRPSTAGQPRHHRQKGEPGNYKCWYGRASTPRPG